MLVQCGSASVETSPMPTSSTSPTGSCKPTVNTSRAPGVGPGRSRLPARRPGRMDAKPRRCKPGDHGRGAHKAGRGRSDRPRGHCRGGNRASVAVGSGRTGRRIARLEAGETAVPPARHTVDAREHDAAPALRCGAWSTSPSTSSRRRGQVSRRRSGGAPEFGGCLVMSTES